MFERVFARVVEGKDQAVPVSAEIDLLEGLQRRRVVVPAGQDVGAHCSRADPLFIVTKGWVASCRMLPNGARQILDFRLPSDMIGVRAGVLKKPLSSFEAISEVHLTEFSLGEILDEAAKKPELSVALLKALSRDDAIVAEHMVNLARRSATERTLHLMLELSERLKRVGQADHTGFHCPLSQSQLADALGQTSVHMSRVLKQLREEGLMKFQKSHVEFFRHDVLVERAGFEIGYLC